MAAAAPTKELTVRSFLRLGHRLAASFCLVILLGLGGYFNTVRAMQAYVRDSSRVQRVINDGISSAKDVEIAAHDMASYTDAYVYSSDPAVFELTWVANESRKSAFLDLQARIGLLPQNGALSLAAAQVRDQAEASVSLEDRAGRLTKRGKGREAQALYEAQIVPARDRLEIGIDQALVPSLETYRRHAQEAEMATARHAIRLGWLLQAVILVVSLLVAFGVSQSTAAGVRQVVQAQAQTRQSEERYRGLVESSPEAVFVYCEDRIVYANGAAVVLFGASGPQELLGRPVFDIIHPDTLPAARERAHRSQRESLPSPLAEQKYVRLDGTTLDVEAVTTPISWEGSAAGQVLARDITARKAAEEARRDSDARLRTVIATMPVVVFALDQQGVFTYSDGKGLAALGLTPGQVVGQSALDVYAATPLLLEHLQVALGGDPHSWAMPVQGRFFETQTTPLLDSAGRTVGVVGAAYDLTEHKRLEQQLAHQAFHDSLTGLPNRALFLDRLQHALMRAERQQSRAAVLFVDLDNFKVVNDSLGHQAGDDLLVTVTACLTACLRAGDTLARLGGDEFTVLLEDVADTDDAAQIAARIAEALQLPLRVAGRTIFVTASIGLAISADGAQTADDLLREADIAMYQAKNGGKARHVVFDRRMNAPALERLELEAELRRAIDGGELVLHYQPIVSLADGAVREVEALVRWEHPERGLIPPAKFIPIAEETGLILGLGGWVLWEACRQTRAWHAERPREAPLVVGVNLSARQLAQPNLVALVRRALDETGLPPACLKLEITESVLMDDAEDVIVKLHALRALGVRVAIDDFGTGYSSMAYLSALPVDTLKIDRAFIQKMDEPEGLAIIQAIITLAQSLHLQITSEGIETREQWEQLRALGGDHGQGYFFARPQTREALPALLADAAKPLPLQRAA